MGWGYFWPQTCGRALKFNYLRRYFDSGLGQTRLLALTVAGIRWLPDTSGHHSALIRLRATGTYPPQLAGPAVLPCSHGDDRF